MNARPRVRPLEPIWTKRDGEDILVLRDHDGVLEAPVAVPAIVGLILSLADGTRDIAEIAAVLSRETGETLPIEAIEDLIRQLEEGLILESDAVVVARQRALAEFRSRPRPMSHVGAIYPGDLVALRATIDAHGRGVMEPRAIRDAEIRGIIAPHIDFARGGPVYHRVFGRASQALSIADVLVIFGTDHAGSPGAITLTDQDFETPFGTFSTDRTIVSAIRDAIGADHAAAEELHHRGEHSIELALVWAASALNGRRPTIVPILCGSFHRYVGRESDPAADARLAAVIATLRTALDGRRWLAIAAADLAHVGPAFGDAEPLDHDQKDDLRLRDEAMLNHVSWGAHHRFFTALRDEGDRSRVCGLPPIYLTLRLLDDARGEVVAYDQCPADADGTSVVSIAGALLW